MTASSPPAEATNAELIRWAFAVLNTRDVEPLRGFWTDATVERFPDATCVGADAMAAYFERVFAAVPDFHMEIVSVAEQGDDVFVHWHMTGTHTGAPFQGIAPTGRPLALDGIDHFVVRDGTVASNFVVFDQMQFARQVGLLPEDGTRADKGLKGAFNAKTRLLARRR
jgi:predicted ester cyclase